MMMVYLHAPAMPFNAASKIEVLNVKTAVNIKVLQSRKHMGRPVIRYSQLPPPKSGLHDE